MLDEQALLIAIPIRHLRSALESSGETTVLPAGGPGDLDSTAHGTSVLVMTTDDGDADLPAATWAATFVRRVPYAPGSPWPDGVPSSWTEEHAAPQPDASGPDDDAPGTHDDSGDDGEDDWEDDDEDDDEDDLAGPQSFLEIAGLRPLPRDEWLFANELVGKQARGGRSFRPRVPTMVAMPD